VREKRLLKHMSDKTYQAFVDHWKETTDLPTQTMGPFTPMYKWVIKYVKSMPVSIIIGISVIFVLTLFFLLGSTIPSVVSLLQRGF
jgi:hypothetical protein